MPMMVQSLTARLSLMLHGDQGPDGERVPARITPRDGSPAYDEDIVFDRNHVDRSMLGLSITDAEPKMWTLSTAKPIVENRDAIERGGVTYYALKRIPREDGWTEYWLAKGAPPA